MHGFQKRFFILTKDVISYYKNKNGAVREKGQISLRVARVDAKKSTDKNMSINTGTMEIHLKFASPEEKIEWFKAIMECKNALAH